VFIRTDEDSILNLAQAQTIRVVRLATRDEKWAVEATTEYAVRMISHHTTEADAHARIDMIWLALGEGRKALDLWRLRRAKKAE
jgi:CMP-N-acetylneuraminic acid synthetase